jgi:hypothetical protein
MLEGFSLATMVMSCDWLAATVSAESGSVGAESGSSDLGEGVDVLSFGESRIGGDFWEIVASGGAVLARTQG